MESGRRVLTGLRADLGILQRSGDEPADLIGISGINTGDVIPG